MSSSVSQRRLLKAKLHVQHQVKVKTGFFCSPVVQMFGRFVFNTDDAENDA